MQCKLIWPVEDCILSNESIETKRNESKPTPFDSTQILSKRNPSNRKESNRNRASVDSTLSKNSLGRFDYFRFVSFRFDRLASIDSAISAGDTCRCCISPRDDSRLPGRCSFWVDRNNNLAIPYAYPAIWRRTFSRTFDELNNSADDFRYCMDY